MLIYLIRHAHALDGADDAARPLSAKGRRQADRVGRWLRRGRRFEARELWHSPLVRAQETAAILALRTGGKRQLREVAAAGPGADPATLAGKLADTRRSVAVVGHEPHLSALATRLLAGRAAAPLVVMKKGAVLALERAGRRWTACWLVSPGQV
jgi:phosphohistidine phosphatase